MASFWDVGPLYEGGRGRRDVLVAGGVHLVEVGGHVAWEAGLAVISRRGQWLWGAVAGW